MKSNKKLEEMEILIQSQLLSTIPWPPSITFFFSKIKFNHKENEQNVFWKLQWHRKNFFYWHYIWHIINIYVFFLNFILISKYLYNHLYNHVSLSSYKWGTNKQRLLKRQQASSMLRVCSQGGSCLLLFINMGFF